jgi:uncharacterized membrane protein YidH (DUF202 family)
MTVMNTDESKPVMMPVIMVIALTVFSCGIFQPVWFLLQRKYLNTLNEHYKIRLLPVVMIFVLYALIIAAAVFSAGDPDLRKFEIFDLAANICGWISIYLLVSLSFSAKNIMIESAAARGLVSFRISRMLTFFLTVMYLQYKLNRFQKLRMEGIALR